MLGEIWNTTLIIPAEYRITTALIIAGLIVSIGVLPPLKKQIL
jgi:hypothetical protein